MKSSGARLHRTIRTDSDRQWRVTSDKWQVTNGNSACGHVPVGDAGRWPAESRHLSPGVEPAALGAVVGTPSGRSAAKLVRQNPQFRMDRTRVRVARARQGVLGSAASLGIILRRGVCVSLLVGNIGAPSAASTRPGHAQLGEHPCPIVLSSCPYLVHGDGDLHRY